MRRKELWVVCLLCVGLVCGLSLTVSKALAEEQKAAAPNANAAGDDAAKEQLAKESEEAAAASAKDPITADLIVKKVEKAAELLQKEGKAAFPKFKGKNSEFIFAGTYIWVHDMNGITHMHPVKYKLEGKSTMAIKDANGKLFFAEMNKIAKEKGAGWLEYMWPKPGEKTPSKKISYVKLCKIDGVDMVVGCGAYGFSDEEIKKLTGK
jgi:cytochrome c